MFHLISFVLFSLLTTPGDGDKTIILAQKGEMFVASQLAGSDEFSVMRSRRAGIIHYKVDSTLSEVLIFAKDNRITVGLPGDLSFEADRLEHVNDSSILVLKSAGNRESALYRRGEGGERTLIAKGKTIRYFTGGLLTIADTAERSKK